MSQIIDLKSILSSPDALAVLAECVYMPDKEKLSKKAEGYMNNSNVVIYGCKEEGAICGLIVLDISNNEEITILDIAVGKRKQHTGIGRKLIDYALHELKPNLLTAETDDEAVDFYCKCGFIINNLGEKYPGAIRYECKYYNIFR